MEVCSEPPLDILLETGEAAAEPSTSAPSSAALDIADYMSSNPATVPIDALRSIIDDYPRMPPGYDYPRKVFTDRTRTYSRPLYATEWEQEFPWLVYSPKLKGGLCRYCALGFSQGYKGAKAGQLVQAPLSDAREPLTVLRGHHSNSAHTGAVLRSQEFIRLGKKFKSSVLK
jgi:hypothetical protein